MKDKAEIFEKKTLDAATNLILTKLEELRGDKAENKEMKRRRWIWELIQNANDCSDKTPIDISITTDETHIVFSHNGNCFTYENLVDLITQISTKVKDEKKVGKFGTGFIATHLLSDKVRIRGIYHESEESNEYKNLDLLLDRSGNNAEDISESIQNAFEVLDSLGNKSNINLDESKMTTYFIYEIENDYFEVKEAIEKGFLDWDRTIPFVLAFSNNIKSIQFNDIYVTKEAASFGEKSIRNIKINYYKNNALIKCKYVSINESENVSVASLLNYENGRWSFENMIEFPKLFCMFPLVGTENFPFPLVINSKRFHVSQERNGIHEGVQENIEIINDALSLYEELIDYWVRFEVENFFYLCLINDDSERSAFLNEYKEKVQLIYKHAEILPVIMSNGVIEKKCLIDSNDKRIIIPFFDRDKRGFWELIRIYTSKSVPLLDEIIYWKVACPENVIDIPKFINVIEKSERVHKDIERIGERVYFEVLNKLDSICFDEQKGCYMYKISYLNQNMEFCDIDKLKIDDGIDKELKDILFHLGKNIKTKLIHSRLMVFNEKEVEKYNNENIASEICAIIRRNLASESQGTARSEEEQIIYNRLTDWFINNSSLAKILFSDIYEKQHLLTKPEETIRRLNLANQVENMMKRNNINISILNELVDKSSQILKMVQDGETRITPELKELLEHISLGNPMSREYFEKIMSRSIENVHDALVKNPLYEVDEKLSTWKENSLSRTVFVAQKNGKEIHIIVRPSDDSKIIFYEDTEFEALDECESELWTDNGQGRVIMITLGDLIKTTGITKIPLKKIV